MENDQVLVSGDDGLHSMTLSEFLTAPAENLGSASERIWLGFTAGFAQIPEAIEILPAQAQIVQFHSDPVFHNLVELAAPTVNASLGVSGLTAIHKPLLDVGGVSHQFDPNRPEQALSIEFLLGLAEHCESWEVRSLSGTTGQYHSMLPIVKSPSDQKLLKTLQSLSDGRLAPHTEMAADEIRAGLLLIHDYLEPSHQISQSMEGTGRDCTGDYWHGLMHRREPDFGNAKYWFRRVGEHPCFERLSESAQQLNLRFEDSELDEWVDQLTRSGWNSQAAVDFYQEAHLPHLKGSSIHQFASCLQMQEMLILLAHCCR